MNVHREPAEFPPCLKEFITREGDTVQVVGTLSPNSMPQELLELCIRETGADRLRKGAYIDMCRIATAEPVRAGQVPMLLGISNVPNGLHHTLETYCMHLRNILRLMEQHENYCFLPLEQKNWPSYDPFVSEGGLALILRTTEPFLMLEIRWEPMVAALREHLLRKAVSVGYDGMHRENIRMALRALIQELGG